MSYPDLPLYELLGNQAKANLEAVALKFNGIAISYGELLENIDSCSQNLWSEGVRPGQTIAIALDRSPDLIYAIFAVLRCGASYVPIDTSYPAKRIEMIVDDSDASFVICDLCKETRASKAKIITIDTIRNESNNSHNELLQVDVPVDSPAYTIYTSGSTGRPKGVQVSHKNVVNLVHSMGQEPGIGPKDNIFAVTTISFDAMVMETFLPLLHGATVVLVDEDTRRDGNILLKKALEDKITVMWGTPSIWRILLDSGWDTKLNIKILIGGEPVPMPLAHELLDRCDEVWNIYGPTETTVCCLLAKITKDDDPITVGKPVANTQIYLLDDKGKKVGPNEVGEIVIGGDGVSLGYLNRPELTAESFIANPFDKKTQSKMYLSGDLGKLLPNGQIQCLGRRDKQVKVRGHRIELGEIETILDGLAEIKKAMVITSDFLGGEPQLVAYIQSVGKNEDTQALRQQLGEIVPDYLIPSIFMWVKEFPVTTNGKIDIKKLPKPKYIRPNTAPLFKKPRTQREKDIAKIWSEKLQIPAIGIDDNFFEMGGSSLLTQKVVSAMKQQLNLMVPVTKIYQYPTISALSNALKKDFEHSPSPKKEKTEKGKSTTDVAIIGMAGRFPGALSIEELWGVLKDGKETISFFTAEELDKAIPEALRNDPLYVKARGVVPSAKEFDARFFGLNPKLAQAMDPQQRLFLEIAWEVLEQSGHLPKHFDGSIGVYAGTGTNTYYKNNVLPNKELLNQVGHLQANTVNEKDYIASRTAYHLNLKGPAVSVHSACSTSLLAIAEAVEAIRNGQCDIALAGGSSLTAPINSGHLYQEGSMLSSDGHCRSFDAEGKGTVFSDGAGVILLKNLEDAKKDGDFIYGLIKGVGINNDGGGKGSFTAPSVEGQADAISRALDDAQISPDEISYLEAHGTATPLGDPIEMEGLHMAFGAQDKKGYCALGSIKSNMGHLTAAAGVAGLIKTILAMNNRQIPASLGFSKPNPAIDFENSPFFVNAELRQWDVDQDSRKAGISSFGVGGTNVHVVVEEYVMEAKNTDPGRPLQLLPWSAKTETSLETYGDKLGTYLISNASLSLADISYSLKTTRDSFAHRQFVLSNSTKEASEKLLKDEKSKLNRSILKVVPSEVAFMFPGQGAQYLQMGKALYEHEIVFREAVDNCSDLLVKDLKEDIRKIIFPETNSTEAEEKLKDTRFTQPALFVIEYALAQLWMSWGITPTLICGHSIGEFVGAHLAGIFNLEDALHLIAVRGRLVSELPGGSMLSIRMTAEEITKILPESLSMAAINSDRLCVVSGDDKDIGEFIQIIKKEGIPHVLLATSHAFHSTMMDPVLDTFKHEVKKTALRAPNLPVISTVTGKKLSDSDAIDPEYWTNHLRATVRFSDAMDTILKLDDIILLEVGPGKSLTTLARQKKVAKSKTIVPSLPIPKTGEGSYTELLSALGNLWLNGLEPDWAKFYSDQSREKLKLPTYAFDRKPCWVDPIESEQYNNTNKILTIEPTKPVVTSNSSIEHTNNPEPMRKPIILKKISELIANASGIELEDADFNYSFLELGLDSLILTQIALTCKKEFNIPITFRQLNEEFSTPELLAGHLDKNLPKDAYAPVPAQTLTQPLANVQTTPTVNAFSGNQNTALNLIAQQLQLLGKQVELMQGGSTGNTVNESQTSNVPIPTPFISKSNTDENILSEEEKKEHKKPFGASPKIEKQSTDLNDEQKVFLEDLIGRYNAKTLGSKNYAQENRAHMSDPRVVSGFKPLTKEMIYPLVIEKSTGNRLWDLDGNEYIDALNGFGSCLFGHQPDFVKEALQNQIEQGYEVGPQHPLAGEVCELLCEFTNHERAALCNTGSEAVLGAMRIARTVTGRSLIVAFSKSYHGINDEGIVRGSKKLRTFPAAAGILPEAVQNMLILDYGTEESLKIIKERAHELAAVLVEPIQSRRPEFQPLDFIKEIREITTQSETALIFDEVITGFRVHPGGFQELFGIKADIATYGKVIGGGLSIGAILGKSEFMDALDGGHWQYGDDSYPEVGVTYFAGTFVRHPLALAASKASLLHMKEKGGNLQNNLATFTERMASHLNLAFLDRKIPMEITFFSSLWRINFKEELPYAELLFVLLRKKGIHIWDGFPCFLTTAYTQEDVNRLIATILESIDELAEVGLIPSKKETINIDERKTSAILNKPPVPGARLGQDESGNPAWFVADVKREGEYVKIEL